MEELKKINSKVRYRQIGRLIGGCICGILGFGLIGNFCYQKGITNYQKYMSVVYPEEFESIEKKLIDALEKSNH